MVLNRGKRLGLFFLCTAALVCASACIGVKYLAFAAAPTTEKVPAECNLLENRTVLVYVWAPPEILWDYPKLRLDLAAYLSEYLRHNVKNISLTNYLRVESVLEKSNAFEIDPAALGRQFRADLVVQVDVYKFSIRDPGRAHLYRGRVGSGVVVHNLSRPGEPPERLQLKDVEITYPEDNPIGFANVRPEQVRQATFELFAVEVGKKFHEHERPVD